MYLGVDNSNDLTIEAGGNVGIGTTTPRTKLEISGGNQWSPLRIGGTSTTGVGLDLLPSSAFPGFSLWAGAGTYANKLLISRKTGEGSSSELVTITSGGNVGIGVTSPGAKLEVNGGAIRSTYSSSVQYSELQQVDDKNFNINLVSNAPATKYFNFQTGGTKRLSIDSNGNLEAVGKLHTASGILSLYDSDVCIKRVANASNHDMYFQLDGVAGSRTVLYLQYVGPGVGVGTQVYAPSGYPYALTLPNNSSNNLGKGIAYAWPTYSSIRWKENIIPISNALQKIKQLRGVYYDWKPEYGGAHDIGLIAEEVGDVIPEVVSYETDSKYASSLDYERLVALLIEGIKEQQEYIEGLEKRLEEIEKRLQITRK